MQIDIAIPAGTGGIFAEQSGGIGFLNRLLHVGRFVVKLAANIDVAGMRVDREAREQNAFQQAMRIIT